MKERPAHVNPAQMAFREFARGHIFHYLAFNNESQDPFGGLKILHEHLRKRKEGVVVVEMHFSQIDPAWALNDVTEKMGFRSIPVTQPIAADRTPFYLPLAARFAGINMVKVVSPDVKERADKKDPNNKVVQGAGMTEYMHKAVEIVKKGGIVGSPTQATREPQLKLNDGNQAVTTKLLVGLIRAGLEDFAIHFVAFDMKGLNGKEDYESKKRRRYNRWKKHTTIHGGTYTLAEFLKLAEVELPPETSARKKAAIIAGNFAKIELFVYQEQARIAPDSYLPKGY